MTVWSPKSKALVTLSSAGMKGGQTEIFWYTNDPTRCAGLPAPGTDWEPSVWEKLEALIEIADPALDAAFPDELLFDPRDQVTPVGFGMRRMTGHPHTHVVTPAGRHALGLKWDVAEVREVAREFARLFARFERLGMTQNDAHGGNYLIDWPATAKAPRVSRVDALSFGFHWNNEYYGCDAAVFEYMPPELHGKELATIEFTREADRYSLACLLFALLTDGGLPWGYAGNKLTPAERVARKEFALLSNPRGTKVPKFVEDAYGRLPTQVTVLIQRAFLGDPDKRPSPQEWISALKFLGAKAKPRRRGRTDRVAVVKEAVTDRARPLLTALHASRWMILALVCAAVAAIGVPNIRLPSPSREPTPAVQPPAPTSDHSPEPPVAKATTGEVATPTAGEVAKTPAPKADDNSLADLSAPATARQPRDKNAWGLIK